MTRKELALMVLEVLDKPHTLRIIVDTQLPTLAGDSEYNLDEIRYGEDFSDTLYYMIDRSDDMGETVSDKWHITNSCGGAIVVPTHALLLDFIERITSHCPDATIWVETY